MGQQHSDLFHLPNVHYNPRCDVLEKAHDPHYGEVKIVRDIHSSEKMILRETAVTSKEAFEIEASGLIKRTNHKHPNIVSVIGFNFQEKQKFCSSYFKISIFIEDIAQTLEHQLESRKATGVSFTDNEVLFIADSILNALTHLHSQGLYHGDIRPSNIFTKERIFKLSDPALAPERGTTGLSLAILHNTKTFLAPELLGQVPQRRFDISSDPHKADIFSLGATLLSLATLTDSEDFFEHHNGAIKTNILNERLETVRLTYSEYTYELIKSMLEFDVHLRPSIQDLTNRLLPYRDQIQIAYMNPGTPMGHFNSSTIDFTFAGVKTETELVKKSARLPVDDGAERHHHHHHRVESQKVHQDTAADYTDNDLDARIRAALERSQATFKALHSGSTPYNPTPQLGLPNDSYYSVYANPRNEKIMEIGTHKEAELAKSSKPQDTLKHSTYTPTNYPATNVSYPAYSQHNVTAYNQVSQPRTEPYSAYATSYNTAAHDPLSTRLINSSYLHPNTYTSDVRASSYVPPTTTTTTYTVPYNYSAQSGQTQTVQPVSVQRAEGERALRSSATGAATTYPYSNTVVQSYSNITPYAGASHTGAIPNYTYGAGSHIQGSVRPEDGTTLALGGGTAVSDGHGPAGFTEQLGRIGFVERNY